MIKMYFDIGDVIKSKYFVNGTCDNFESGVVKVNASPLEGIIRVHDKSRYPKERVHRDQSGMFVVDISVNDSSRRNASYVVESCSYQPVRQGPTDQDYESAAMIFLARRLDSGMQYNPNGEVIQFNTLNGYDNYIPKNEITRIGRMQHTFVDFKRIKQKGGK